jgi:hypothetical protein
MPGPEAKRLPAVEPVGTEVGMIERENIVETTLFGKNDQRSICQIHWPIMVFLHQGRHAATIFQALVGNLEIAFLFKRPKSRLPRPAAGLTE